MKTTYVWKSGFAQAAQGYISLKKQTGMKFERQEHYLRNFDTFYYNNGFEGARLTKEIVHDFIYDKNERPSSHHNKEVVMRDFAKYLTDRGFRAYVADIKTPKPRCKFIPHIFTDDETRRIFTAIDNYPQIRFSYRNTVDPVLFRFLYGTGVRISEALNIVLNDVDTQTGIVTIRAAKNMKDRLLPMAVSLANRIAAYIESFHKRNDDDMWLFPSIRHGNIGQMDTDTAYHHFRDYLFMADITHSIGGPRLHDFRHSLAVKCLKKWVMAGNDLTVMLPYLSAYMGHSDFRATQYYLRLTSGLYPDILRRAEAEFGYVIPEGGFDYDET